MLAYNIGLKKIIFQNTLGVGEKFVFNLPDDHHFLNFVKYNSFNDFAYKNDKSDSYCSSYFVFLTIDKSRKD